jgi:hypothetical protein
MTLEGELRRATVTLKERSLPSRFTKTLRLAIVIILTALCWSTFGLVLFLDGYYYRTAPREPDTKSGRVYAHNVKTIEHVAHVYLTRTEKMPYDCYWYFVIAFGVAAYVLNQRWKCFPPRKRK